MPTKPDEVFGIERTERERPSHARALEDLPWLRCETPSAVIVLAIDDGRIVGGSPYGMSVAKFAGGDVFKFWRFMEAKGFTPERIDPCGHIVTSASGCERCKLAPLVPRVEP